MRWKVSNNQIFTTLGGSSCLSTASPIYALSEKSIKSKDGITSKNLKQINYNHKEQINPSVKNDFNELGDEMKTNNKTLLLSLLVLLLIVSNTSQAQSHWEPVPFTLINPPVYSLLKVADTLFFGGSHVAKDSVGNFSVILGGYVKDRIFGIPFGVTAFGSFVGSLEYHQGFLYINGFNSHEQGPGIWKWREGEKEKMLNIEASDNVAMAIKGSSLYMVGRIGVIDTPSTKIGYYDIIQFHEKSLNKIRELKKHDIEAISIWGDSLYLGDKREQNWMTVQ